MSDQTSFEVKLFSPRWGHEDVYQVQLNRNQMSVSVGGVGVKAVCSWVENLDPEWLGYSDSIGNPLENILRNEN